MIHFSRSKSNEACSICFEPMDDGEEVLAHVTNTQNKVQHAFHAACLGDWLKRNNTCPTCRAQVINDNTLLVEFQQTPIAKVFFLTCLGVIAVVIILRRHIIKP